MIPGLPKCCCPIVPAIGNPSGRVPLASVALGCSCPTGRAAGQPHRTLPLPFLSDFCPFLCDFCPFYRKQLLVLAVLLSALLCSQPVAQDRGVVPFPQPQLGPRGGGRAGRSCSSITGVELAGFAESSEQVPAPPGASALLPCPGSALGTEAGIFRGTSGTAASWVSSCHSPARTW